jgi:hypothetical protein
MPGARVVVPAAFILCATASALIAWTGVRSARVSSSARDIAFGSQQGPDVTTTRLIRVAAALSLIALGVALLTALDVTLHRRVEEGSGLNIRGYRGAVAKQKTPGEIRVVVLGGSTAFGQAFAGSIPLFLQDYLNNPRLRQGAGYLLVGPISVVNLATPYDRPPSFQQTLWDYDHLRYDVVCLYLGHDDPRPRGATVSGWRRQSMVFRISGYLPILPSLVPWPGRVEAFAPDDRGGDLGAIDAVIDDLLTRGKKVMVATHPFVSGEESRRQDAAVAHLVSRFGQHPGFAYLDLRRTVEPQADLIESDRVHATPLGNSRIAESLSQSMFRLLKS